ncbi:conserved hypothetical protein [Coccidioides posadasii str. Silveira]|uniref:Uncharacterized protein n=1 Tax=Coccidioides posadasii (strain RMSCC 757 / Silveira) TaxID=443226 RepID=E9DFV0_COCPS|nr:conserved hypothetical protein [Coccidioides posadasii str. Silveira]
MTTASASRPVFTTPTRLPLAGQMQAQTPTPSHLQSSPSPHPPQQTQAAQAAQAAMAAREKARVTTLLDINSALLQEVVNLQSAGKTGGSNQPGQSVHSGTVTCPLSRRPSGRAVSKLRSAGREARWQANLAYLATIADRAKKSGVAAPLAPAIMTPPPSMPGLNAIYAQLNELFPEAAKATAQVPPQPRQMQVQNVPHLMPQATQPMHGTEGMAPGGMGVMTG